MVERKMITIVSSVDSVLEQSAAEILAEKGLTINDAVHLLLKQIVQHQGLPFPAHPALTAQDAVKD
jgi:addiction module RelB/DinJ family antitoxin